MVVGSAWPAICIKSKANGAFYKVEGVVAVNVTNDLAVLRLDGSGFTYLTLGNSDAEQVGDKVIAIGSPLGLEASVSDGLVSAIRTLDSAPVTKYYNTKFSPLR